jgi:hypothetical protein
MGKICSGIVRGIEFRELSIVNEPADKGSRITEFGESGNYRNIMTWRLGAEPQIKPKSSSANVHEKIILQ